MSPEILASLGGMLVSGARLKLPPAREFWAEFTPRILSGLPFVFMSSLDPSSSNADVIAVGSTI